MVKSCNCLFGVAVVTATLGFADAGRAAGAEEGYRLSSQWCSSCHIVAPGQAGSDAARPFEAVANDPGFSADGLRTWLTNPHGAMPDLTLSRAELDAIVAYISSLRKE